MKKFMLILFASHISHLIPHISIAQNLTEFYNSTLCGLNYTQASVLLTDRKSGFNGVAQPASLTISGIPAGAKIEKAFAWWDIAGNDTVANVTIQNPNSQTGTFSGVVLGGGNNFCNGNGYAFRADITGIVSGNGIYVVSGLPSDSTLITSDATGITLFIIYSDIHAGYAGTLHIEDGYLKVSQDTITEVINYVNAIYDGDTSYGTGFMLVSEMEAKPGNAIQMCNSNFVVPVQNFWDYEDKLAAFPFTQTDYTFGVRSPNDCSQLMMIGLYFQENVEPVDPVITSVYGGEISVTTGSSYQWFFNNTAVVNSNVQTYHPNASQSGNYFAEVSDEFGCAFASDTIAFVTCEEKITPNINFQSPDSLWTDSVNYTLQWFFEGLPVTGSTLPYHIAVQSGFYWVQAQDNVSGCSVISNVIEVTEVGMKEGWKIENENWSVYPNPNGGKFNVLIPNRDKLMNGRNDADSECSEQVVQIKIYNLFGELVYITPANEQQITANLPSGMYLLKITSQEKAVTVKMIVE